MTHESTRPATNPLPKPSFYTTLVRDLGGLLAPSSHHSEHRRTLHASPRDWILHLGNASSLLYFALNDPPYERRVNWTGWYLVYPEDQIDESVTEEASEATRKRKKSTMRLGPFQGRVACTAIQVGRGVCGAAAERGETIVVTDVEAFPGHIACDSASRSEIVVPIKVPRSWVFPHSSSADEKVVVGVLDLDCAELSGFDEDDRAGLEKFVDVVVDAVGENGWWVG
ncbi:GAF domain-like protein [Gonapodya prolifera JEL478]|uniref:GAF domain-like protein n=1 Tax=Gonapodya prolifera (strain JEL478) TaxID=1344416 RepID=A0A139AJ42_GONPJ|nr:GAF domain-like protein [Gonapodya prolifera JEL478]|eukprot:KXS16831.1 GAF domain-like protein [Gonapodya prolifera JEL478]